jgi:hypothetical protein
VNGGPVTKEQPTSIDNVNPGEIGDIDWWGAPVQLSPTGTHYNYQSYAYQNPSCVDAQGNFYVSWYSTELSYNRILVRRWVRATATWDTAWTVSLGNAALPAYAFRPGIAVDANGVLHAVWYSSTTGAYGIWYNTYNPATGAFGYAADTCIYDPGGNYVQYHPSIACRPGGNEIHVAWQSRDASNPTYYAAKHMEYTPGVGWSTPTIVDTGYHDAVSVGCAVDADNDVSVTYAQAPFNHVTTSSVWLVTRTAGVWGHPEQINLDTVTNSQYMPSVAVGPTGTVHAVWHGYDPPRHQQPHLLPRQDKRRLGRAGNGLHVQ